MDQQSPVLGEKNDSSTQTICLHSTKKMQDSTKEDEHMNVAESSSSSADGGPRGVEEEKTALTLAFAKGTVEGIRAFPVPVNVYPKKSIRNTDDKRMGENESSSNPRTEGHEYTASSFFSSNQPVKLIGIKNDMDDEPLDLSLNSASWTKETSTEKQHFAENYTKLLRALLLTKSNVSRVADFSSPEENSRMSSQQESKKYLYCHKIKKLNKPLESQDVIMESNWKTKGKLNQDPSTNSDAKRRRAIHSPSSRKNGDRPRLLDASDRSETASGDYISSQLSRSADANSNYDSTTIQKSPTSRNSLSSFVCKQCGKGFPSNFQLERHFRTHGINKTNKSLDSQDMIPEDYGDFKRNKSEMSTNSEAKIYRDSDPASSRMSEGKSRLPADSDCSKAASAEYLTCRPSTIKSTSCSPDSTAIQEPSTSRQRVICEYCNKDFQCNSMLKRHVRTHTGEKPFGCQRCGKRFTQKSNLKDHEQRCGVCKKSFFTHSKLTRHIRNHTQEKSFTCKKCEKSFAKNEDLKRHVRIHTGEKPYVCKICGKAFAQKGNLNTHEKTHEKMLEKT